MTRGHRNATVGDGAVTELCCLTALYRMCCCFPTLSHVYCFVASLLFCYRFPGARCCCRIFALLSLILSTFCPAIPLLFVAFLLRRVALLEVDA